MIYPVDIRDILFWFAYYELFTPKWSQHIFDELEQVMSRKEISGDIIRQQISRANKAFPDALVKNYEALIETLELPDRKDRHVLAAAIKTNANIIVTNNLEDFPSAKSADDFITDLIDLNHKAAVEAFRSLVLNRTNPDLDEYEVLDIFRNRGLKETADYLHSLI
ncbi:MAG: PIN domain-containing protein [Owenweeksia sp.]|nr:PIN domain-containing protein [Owenweeksia sp.]